MLLLSHLASPREVTGAERSLLHLAAGLRDRGDEVEFVAPEEGASVDEARSLGLAVHVVRWPRLFLASGTASPPMSTLRALCFVAGMGRVPGLQSSLEGLRADVALVNTLVNVAAAWAAREAGLPVLWRVAELPGPGLRRRFFARVTGDLATRVVAVSGAVADALLPVRAEVIHSGVRLPDEMPIARARADLRRQLGLPGDALVIGHVGQVRPHKGQLELVEAALLLDASIGAEATFVVLGSEESDPRHARRVRERGSGLGERLRFAGFVPGAGLAAASLDVLAFTSRAPDPFPLVVLEAMAAGVPVVAFAAGGVPEAVADGETGLLVPAGDVRGLAAAIERLLFDPGLRLRLGSAARARAAEQFTVERCVDRYRAGLAEIARNA